MIGEGEAVDLHDLVEVAVAIATQPDIGVGRTWVRITEIATHHPQISNPVEVEACELGRLRRVVDV